MSTKWHIEPSQGSRVLAIVDENDNSVCDVWSCDKDTKTLDENAVLISKAPEMFELLKDVYQHIPTARWISIANLINEIENNE